MELRAQVLLTTIGVFGRTGAVKDQSSFHPAPSATQRFKVSICLTVRVLCENSGGIRRDLSASVIR